MMTPKSPTSTNRLMVYVRVKPSDEERKSIIDIVDQETLVFDPVDSEIEQVDEYIYHGQRFKTIGHKKCKNCPYTFDKVFNSEQTNEEIHETVTKPMVDAVLDGLNCCVFAYGATGSGKTFTMLGSESYKGVVYHTSNELFEKLKSLEEQDVMESELKICYFEIYNEKIRDLLVWEPNNYIRCGNKRLRTTPERCRARQYNLQCCEGPKDGSSLVIAGLTYHTPQNADELLALLAEGNRNRSQHPTDANADSSRSHAIFQIVLTRRNCVKGGDYELQHSKLSLIDLAGSERASVAYRPGNDRSKNLQREGGNINKSLLALGNCINALADPRSSQKYIPYRNSKLTRLLKDSLGGKCRTAMIATVCQQSSHYDDTQNTLMYASRAKCIKLRPGRNFTDVAIQPRNYNLIIDNQSRQINSLNAELERLRDEVESLRSRPSIAISQFNPSQTYIASENGGSYLDKTNKKQQLDDLYERRAEIRMNLLKYESKFRQNELKLVFKRLDEERQQVLSVNQRPRTNGDSTFILTSGTNNNNLINENSQALKAQLEYYERERNNLLHDAKMNQIHIEEHILSMATEFEMRSFGGSDDFKRELEPYKQLKEMAQELQEKRFSEQHAYDIAQYGMNRLVATEGLLVEAANVIRYTHGVVKIRGLSDTLESRMTQLLRKLDGKKDLVWKDAKYTMENANSDKPLSQLTSVHDNFSLNFLTPLKNNNTLMSRRLSSRLAASRTYTPEQTNTTFDASH